jgi:hypothetical protein
MVISKLIIKLLKSLYPSVHPLAEFGKSTKDFEEGKEMSYSTQHSFSLALLHLLTLGESQQHCYLVQ